MPNPYLKKKREQFAAIVATMEGVQTRAHQADRELSEDELRSLQGQRDEANLIATEIEQLTEFETRAAAVGQLAATVDEGVRAEQRAGGQGGSAYTQDRDPGHYRSVREGGQYSFFADLYAAGKNNDQAAHKRLEEHRSHTLGQRAVTQAGGGVGIIPPKWLTDEYQAMGRQNRVLSSLVRRIPLGDDPRALILPKQTAQVDANLLTQAAEGANTAGWGTDRFTSNKDTLTPATYAAYQDVARQLVNGSNPSADVLIMTDLREAWDTKVEALTGAAIVAGGTVSTTFATQTLFKASAAGIDAVVDAQTAVAGDLRGPADIAAMSYFQFGAFRKFKDTTNRPLMPVTRYNPQNSRGGLGNVLVGDIEGVDAYGTVGIVRAGNIETIAVMRSQAVILAESDLLEFTYDQVVGPSLVRMGVWGYVGTLVRNPVGVQLIVVTDATS